MPARQERAERLPGRAEEGQVDGVVRQARAAVAAGQLGAEHRADRAVDVADRQLRPDRLAALEGILGEGDQVVVEGLLQPVVLAGGAPQRRALGQVRQVQDRRQVEPAGLPVLDRPRGVEHLGVADRLVQRPEAQRGEVLADLLGDVAEELLDELRLAGEALAQHGVLGGDAHRAGVEVADPHHHAAHHHQRRRGEAVLLGAQQRGDHDVAAGLELAVGLHDDPVAQPVEQQRLLRLGQAQLPRACRRA